MYVRIHERVARPPSGNGRAARTLLTLPRLLALSALLAFPLVAQSPGTPLHLQNQPRQEVPYDPGVTPSEKLDAHRIAQLNTLRQKAMVTDAEKLLRLAKELNEDATAGGTILSLPEKMRKAAEIEKLAKNVKDKMTYTVGEPSQLVPFPAGER